MQLFVTSGAPGPYLGAVVIAWALNQNHARRLIDEATKEHRCKADDVHPYDIEQLPGSHDEAGAHVLFNGDY